MENYTKFSDAQLLAALKEEREKFTKSDKDIMQSLVDLLVLRGIYIRTPAMTKHNYSFLTMVEAWGVNWNVYREPFNCPKCNSEWRDLVTGPPFKREIGISQKDRCVAYRCPDCGHEIPR